MFQTTNQLLIDGFSAGSDQVSLSDDDGDIQ